MSAQFHWCDHGNATHSPSYAHRVPYHLHQPSPLLSLVAESGSNTNSTGGGGNCETTGIILGSFFYGYIASQILGGVLATRYGGKHVFGFGVLVTSILTIATPLAARQGVPFLVGLRVLEGIGEGVTFPAFHAVLGQWVPMHERSKFGTFAYSGAAFGTVVSSPLSGYLCSLDGGFALSVAIPPPRPPHPPLPLPPLESGWHPCPLRQLRTAAFRTVRRDQRGVGLAGMP